MLKAFPFTIFPLIAFNLLVFVIPDQLPDGWATEIWSVPTYSQTVWTLTAGDVLVLVGLFFLFIEMFRATSATRGVIGNHLASVVVLIVYVGEFLVVEEAANSTFFMLAAIALVDVLAGFTVTARVASRDVSINDL